MIRRLLLFFLLVSSFTGYSQIHNFPYENSIYATVYSNGKIYSIAESESIYPDFVAYDSVLLGWQVFDTDLESNNNYYNHLTVWQEYPILLQETSRYAEVLRYLPDGTKEVILPESRFDHNALYDSTSCRSGQFSKTGFLTTHGNGEVLNVFVSTIGGVSGLNGGPSGSYVFRLSATDSTFQCLHDRAVYKDVASESKTDFWIATSYADGSSYNSIINNLFHHTEDSIQVFNEETVPDDLASVQISSIEVFQGILYLTGYDHAQEQFVLTTYSNGNWDIIPIPASLNLPASGYHPLLFEIDEYGRVWFYHDSFQGIFTYDGDSWSTISESEGLLQGNVNHVFIDNNNGVWVSTSSGVSYIGESIPHVILSKTKKTAEHELMIWPNPSRNIININNYKSYSNYRIYTSSGRMVQEGNSKDQIDVSRIPKGIYQLIFISENQEPITKKLVLY